jgi:hypothetical protein
MGVHHKVHKYLEYHSVCPLVRIGDPTPSPSSECASPGTKGAVDTLACVVGNGGVPIRTAGEKA